MLKFDSAFLSIIRKQGFVFSLAACVFVIIIGHADWIVGILAGSVWLFVKIWLLSKLVNVVQVPQAINQKAIFIICLIKFPVLYLMGLILLLQPFVRLEGVLIGFTAYLVATLFGYIKGIRSF